MKHAPLLLSIVGGMLITASGCSTQVNPLPAILQNHKDRTLFTKLDDKSNTMVDLFNGKDLTNFYTYTDAYGRNTDTENAFKVTDSAIHLDGQSMGYLCTEQSYKNYYLKVVFRWGEKRYPPREHHMRDSGILYHFKLGEADKVWPKSVECQVQENDCGDFFLVDGTTAKSPNMADGNRIFRTEDFENECGEWNTIEVICYDDKAEHYVNGNKVNEATELSVTEGRIMLQLEAAEVFYKSVALLQLK